MLNSFHGITKSFVIATLCMIALSMACSSPIPFFATFQGMYQISDSILSFSTVLYFIGNVCGLIFLSRISNYIGRRPTILITLTIIITGCISFYLLDNVFLLLLGRFLLGLGCGMSAGSIQSYILDTANPESNLGVIVSTNIPLIGFSIGSLISAFIVDLYPNMIKSVFLLLILFIIICMFLLSSAEETIIPKNGVLSSLKPEILVPSSIKVFIPLSMILLISTYSMTGFFQTFSSTMALMQFSDSTKILAALIYISLIAPQILGSFLISKINTKDAQCYGLIAFTLLMILVTIALAYRNLYLFIMFTVLASLSCGVCFTSCINNLVSRITQQQRSGTLSAIYIITDGGTAIVNMIVSFSVHYLSYLYVLYMYIMILILSSIIVFRIANRLSFS